jgi:hypothetical protein
LIAGAAIEALEGAAAVGFGLYVGWETIAGKPLDPASAIGVTVLAILGGVGMLFVARGLVRAQRWSRAPAFMTQFFALPISVSMIQSGQYGFGIPLAVLAVAALVLIFCKPSHDVLVRDE